VNVCVDELHKGSCLRAVVKISNPPQVKQPKIKVISSTRLEEGLFQTVEHYSETVNGFMTFSIYLPDAEIREQRGKPYPALYFLAGLTCTHDNVPTKSGFAKYAKKHRIAVVFPDTSPRKTGIDKIADDWEFGESASYYVDATTDATKKHYQMFSYITKELP
jgi:S-formylglutathione hydrolase